MAQQDVFKEIRKDVIQPWFSHILVFILSPYFV